VHHVFASVGKFVLACLITLGLAALASVGLNLSAGSVRSAAPTPAEIVASRFPSADTWRVMPATFSTASVIPVEHWETFNQGVLDPIRGTLDPMRAAVPTSPTAVETTEPPISEPAQQTATPVESVKPELPKQKATNAPPHRVAGRSGNVLNDAQIASIKRRLNLTAEQDQMWPAVEAALRKIVYTKNAMGPHAQTAQPSGARTAYIDPSSSEVQQLKSAAVPLIMRLNDEQKREVKMLAYVMGLEALVSQF